MPHKVGPVILRPVRVREELYAAPEIPSPWVADVGMTGFVQARILAHGDHRILVEHDRLGRRNGSGEQAPKHQAHRDNVLVSKTGGACFSLRKRDLARISHSIGARRCGGRPIAIVPGNIGSHAPVRAAKAFPDFMVAVMHSPKPVPTRPWAEVTETRRAAGKERILREFDLLPKLAQQTASWN